jgi:hypothetical protein
MLQRRAFSLLEPSLSATILIYYGRREGDPTQLRHSFFDAAPLSRRIYRDDWWFRKHLCLSEDVPGWTSSLISFHHLGAVIPPWCCNMSIDAQWVEVLFFPLICCGLLSSWDKRCLSYNFSTSIVPSSTITPS